MQIYFCFQNKLYTTRFDFNFLDNRNPLHSPDMHMRNQPLQERYFQYTTPAIQLSKALLCYWKATTPFKFSALPSGLMGHSFRIPVERGLMSHQNENALTHIAQGSFLCMGPANERWRYSVMWSPDDTHRDTHFQKIIWYHAVYTPVFCGCRQ